MNKSLETPLQYLKGIGPKRAKLFSKAGLSTVEELLYYFPRRYEDRRKFVSIAQLQQESAVTLKVKVLAKTSRRSWQRRNFHILELLVQDATGTLPVVWFNQPYLNTYFKIGQELILYGKVQRYGTRLQLVSPEFELLGENEKEGSLDIGRIVPLYPAIEGISQRYLRYLIYQALEEFLPQIKEPLNFQMRQRHNLLNLAKSLRQIHFPDNFQMQQEAYRRLSFEEFFFFSIPIILRKLSLGRRPGLAHQPKGPLTEAFRLCLPFSLTGGQEKVISEIEQDMAKPFAMQRLLQGDVGSGKTVVAIYAALIAIQSGSQVAFMVPTEILAKQHYTNISAQFFNLSQLKKINIALLVGSLAEKEKKRIYADISQGKIDLIIGTHALLQEKVGFKKLGLAVIDEQHKFGVAQRSLLLEKGLCPDVLIMTATPIPRTLAITLYGDLHISVIHELPPGRKPVMTQWISEEEISQAYRLVSEKVKEGRQAYIVYPLVEESLKLDLKAAEQMYKNLKEDVFKEFRLGLVHGQMSQKRQDEIMAKFKAGKIDILVSTTVLEVGIDVPNATVMLIEHAERFGLAQLHQLRGRVGRASIESYCVLVSSPKTEEAKARLQAMTQTNDGFRIAEEDLKIRGPGEFFGQRQHGLSELKIADPLRQLQLLRFARQEAIKLLQKDAHLTSSENQLIRQILAKRFPGYEKYIFSG